MAFMLHSFADEHSSMSGTKWTQQSNFEEAALQINQHGNDHEVDECQKITWLMGTQGVQNKTVRITRDNTFIRLELPEQVLPSPPYPFLQVQL